MLHFNYPLVAQWIEQSRPKGEIWVRFLSRGLDRKQLPEVPFIEADDELIADVDDRNPHLTTLLDHFLAFREIARDVVLGKRYFVLGEKLFRHVTKVTCRCCINCDGLLCRHTV